MTLRTLGTFACGALAVSLAACASDPSRNGNGKKDPPPTAAWDWSGVVGTGQSLAVGQNGVPPAATEQPYGNLKLSTGSATWPMDSDDSSFSLVPLTEPIGRPSTGYPSSYPTNIAGETPHAAMANQITALFIAAGGTDHVGVHGEFGENGQGMVYLKKGAVETGVNGRAYEATLMETRAVKRLADEAGKSYGVGAIIVTHGESDAGNANYEAELYQLWSDYNADLSAITAQTKKPLMIVSQQNSVNNRSASTIAAWKIGVNHAEDVVCSGPKYQYPYSTDGVHLVTAGYQALGEKYGQIYFERVVLGRDWQPLQPTTVERTSAREITVHFHVPVPPLVWDETFEAPHALNMFWSNGKGFELRGPAGSLTIESVAIQGASVVVTAAEDLPATGVFVGYALMANVPPTCDPECESGSICRDGVCVRGMSAGSRITPAQGTVRWGLLHDSDPFVGRMTNQAQPNWAVAFELPVP